VFERFADPAWRYATWPRERVRDETLAGYRATQNVANYREPPVDAAD